jgi:hypothetical protein
MSEQIVVPEDKTQIETKEQSTTSSADTSTATSTEKPQTSPDSSTPVEDTSLSKTEDIKPAEEAKPADKANTVEEGEYEIELPEGSSLTQKDLDEVAQLASDLNLNKEQAQKLLESRESVFKSAKQTGEDTWKSKFDNDLKQLTSDPDFSGEARKVADQHMTRAITAFGSQELIEYLNTPQGGTNVHLAKFIMNIGKALAPAESDDPSLVKGQQTPTNTKEVSVEERMYPSLFQK